MLVQGKNKNYMYFIKDNSYIQWYSFFISTVVVFKIPKGDFILKQILVTEHPLQCFALIELGPCCSFQRCSWVRVGFVSQEDFISAQLISAQYLSQELEAI